MRRMVGLVVAAGGLALVLAGPFRLQMAALLLLPHFFPGAVPRPLEYLTDPPQVSTIRVPEAPGPMVADVYHPAGQGRAPAMVLMLGVNPLPRDHPQVVTLAEGIARTGIVTVVAESQAMLDGEIRVEEVDNLVALFRYLERDERVDPRRIGFSGFCIGAVLQLLAASDERIADRVSYVNAFSVYADAAEVLKALLTGTQPGPLGPEAWDASPLTRSVFTGHLIASLPAERDRRLLTRELLEQTPLTSPELQGLSAAGRGLRDLLQAREPARVQQLLETLPDPLIATLNRLSPARTAPRLRARVYLMHDVADSYLPVAGARRLAAAIPADSLAAFTEFEVFSHVVPGQTENPIRFAGEMVKLVSHVNKVLQAAHRVHNAPSAP